MVTDRERAQAALAAQIILTQGYEAFLRWVAANKAAHEEKLCRVAGR